MKAVVLLGAALVMGGGEMKDLLYQDFRGGKFRETVFRRFGPTPAQFMKADATGLRIALPAQAKPIAPVGVACNLAVHGDFEITVCYEIVRADKPTSGYGRGVNLHVVANTSASDNASLARFSHPRQGEVYVTDRGHYTGEGKDQHITEYAPTKVKRGKLRLRRTGSSLQYLAAAGDDEDFQELRRAEFVGEPLKELRVGADAGNAKAAVEIRIKDLRIASQELSASPTVTRSGTSWIWWAVGAPCVGAVVVIAGRVLARRKRRLASGN
jgi:hypothetical protein